MAPRWTMMVAAAGSGVALAGALASQYGLGLIPCQLCLWQRWPHLAAVLIGALALLPALGARLEARPGALRAMALAGALAVAGTGAIGVYHTGVERDWWQGPTACSGGGSGLGGLSPEALLDPTVQVATVVPCGEVAAEALGLSMASWNALYSFALLPLWLAAARGAGRMTRMKRGGAR